MLTKLRRRTQEEKGFTLIELLVVVLIIGILAAIAIPSFLGQRTKAEDSEAKTAARSAQTAMETYFTNERTYVGATPAILQTIEPTLADAGTRLTIPSATANSYSVAVQSKTTDGGGTFTIAKAANGTTTRSCTTANKGGCANGAKW